MHLRISLAMLFLTVFILLVGCGGGNQSNSQSNNGKQDGGAPSGKEEGGKAVKKKAPKVKTALGTLKRVNPDESRIVLRPSSELQGDNPGDKRMFFKVTEKTEINLDDKEAELVDAKRGQQAQIEYVVVKMVENERNRARVVQLFSDGKSGEEPG